MTQIIQDPARKAFHLRHLWNKIGEPGNRIHLCHLRHLWKNKASLRAEFLCAICVICGKTRRACEPHPSGEKISGLPSQAMAQDIDFNKNEDFNKLKVSDLNARLKKVYLGGGEKRIEKLKADGKMTARERIDALLDPKSARIEIGAFAADGMYKEHGGAPSAGVVVVIGYVSKRQCIVVANDATVKAGAWFPMTGKKNLRAQEIAIENRLPIIYLVDSAGVYLPMQDEIFPDKEHFGRIFRNNAVMSSMGITQIAPSWAAAWRAALTCPS